uniref:Uncharacterized protein n=2 Tax=Oryza sativa subsp. japonica TaxID=39947 RepID=Q6YPD6_ORYSJ|nr:hypothetical protein [Oryza sativa Japonica Group]BAD10802.1 hypothetical protein [Oryza sativa Japonica Group]BAD10834.1 hypothetical protein [Oryza sativa Japonica Group]
MLSPNYPLSSQHPSLLLPCAPRHRAPSSRHRHRPAAPFAVAIALRAPLPRLLASYPAAHRRRRRTVSNPSRRPSPPRRRPIAARRRVAVPSPRAAARPVAARVSPSPPATARRAPRRPEPRTATRRIAAPSPVRCRRVAIKLPPLPLSFSPLFPIKTFPPSPPHPIPSSSPSSPSPRTIVVVPPRRRRTVPRLRRRRRRRRHRRRR